jgi:chaperonin GroES
LLDLKDTKLPLKTLLTEVNIAKRLDEEILTSIGNTCWKDYQNDKQSRVDWEERMESAMKLALQVMEDKTFPWPNASNIKFPLVTISALQYHSRVYPALINSENIVKVKIWSEDKDGVLAARGKRIENHMSYQILEEDEDWEENMDKVLITQSIIGCAFKKTYFDSLKKRNISEFIPANDLVVNYYAKDLKTASRITHVLEFSRNKMQERIVRGLFLETDLERIPQPKEEDKLTQARDKAQGVNQPANDSQAPYKIMEQHRYLDLDGDGYAEPYIVFFREDNRQVLRIVARFFEDSITRVNGKIAYIEPEHYFTKFPFIPSPDGGFYDLGWGSLLGPLNESINTIINQLTDAGTMATTAGGFLSRGVKIRGGNNSFAPLEWKQVDSTGDDLRKGIFPLPVREPSNVLFTLLQLLINYGERIGGAVDVLVGENPGQNTPAETSRTMAEQGQKILSGIYKRTYRALKEEFRKWFRLNKLYLDDSDKEFVYGDFNTQKILVEDYKSSPKVILPSADPMIISESAKIAQANAISQVAHGSPGFNLYQVNKRVLEAWKVGNIDQLLPDPQGPNAIQPAPNPKVQVEQIKAQAKGQIEQGKLKLAMAKLQADMQVNQARIKELEAKAAMELSQAQGEQTGHMIALINAQIAAEKSNQDSLFKALEMMKDLVVETEQQPQQGVETPPTQPQGNEQVK